MKLTLKRIMEFDPCGQIAEDKAGISLLAKNLGKTDFLDTEEFTLIDVLNSNGIKDAVWCLRCFDYLDYCLFLADVAESVLHIYESKYDSKAPRKAIQGIRGYKAGKIIVEELKVLADDAYSAASAAAASAAAAYSAAAASAAAYSAAYSAASAAAYEDARKDKWDEIEILFIKHFGEQHDSRND